MLNLVNTYITNEDVDILDEVLFLMKEYAIEDDGEREKFIIESFDRMVRDFKEAIIDSRR